jgi:hypothetical protein
VGNIPRHLTLQATRLPSKPAVWSMALAASAALLVGSAASWPPPETGVRRLPAVTRSPSSVVPRPATTAPTVPPTTVGGTHAPAGGTSGPSVPTTGELGGPVAVGPVAIGPPEPPASPRPAATTPTTRAPLPPPTTTRAPPTTTRPPRNKATGLPGADGIRICYRIADTDIKIQQPCKEPRE